MVEQDNLQKKEREFLKIMMIIALSVLLGVGCTFGYFFEFSPSRDLKTWVDTATIFTGVATPILTTVSVFLLYFVWKDNRRELAETKKALTEQSDTQNFSVIKDAVFDIADKLKERLQEKYTYGLVSKQWAVNSDDSEFKLSYDKGSDGKEQCWVALLEQLINYHFMYTNRDDSFSKDFKTMTLGVARIHLSEQIKIIALFIQALKSPEYRLILETTLFSKFTLFTWLIFVEISYQQFQNASEEDKSSAELVFLEMGGLTCRQAKSNTWFNTLPSEVLAELKARKLL